MIGTTERLGALHNYRRESMLGRPESRLGRTELLELLRLLARCSLGSDGFRPDDLANRLRMSVSDTTPDSRPDRCAPGSAEEAMEPNVAPGVGECGAEFDPGTATGGAGAGDGAFGGDGDDGSTTHIRWDCVATSFATVWASDE